jgi:mRNA interferase MazF
MYKDYIPARGDIVWLNFNPQAGHEQSGKRPALVILPIEYNKVVGLALFCPITSVIKNYPFEVALPMNSFIKGVILSDQIKSINWKIRNATFISHLNDSTTNEVLQKLNTLTK